MNDINQITISVIGYEIQVERERGDEFVEITYKLHEGLLVRL